MVREHAKELGNEVPKVPQFFLKPTSSYVVQPNPILLRPDIGPVHYEIELGVVMKKPGNSVARDRSVARVSSAHDMFIH